MLVMYTLVNADIREPLQGFLAEHPHIVAVDVLTAAVGAVSEMSGMEPVGKPGMLRVVDHNYFKRIGALEFTIAHDDGRIPRSSHEGRHRAFGGLALLQDAAFHLPGSAGAARRQCAARPHHRAALSIFDVDRTRLFGLMITPEVLLDIRRKRIKKAAGKAGGGQFAMLAKNYADPEYIYRDLEASRALMRRLGCIVVHTEGRAVEETAQEILRYYERSHPSNTDIID